MEGVFNSPALSLIFQEFFWLRTGLHTLENFPLLLKHLCVHYTRSWLEKHNFCSYFSVETADQSTQTTMDSTCDLYEKIANLPFSNV